MPVSVTFRAILFPIARLAVNFSIMNRYSCAVQVFPADHAEEAAAVEAPAVALHLLGVVHRPAAGAALVASSPVGHGGAAGRRGEGEAR